MLYQHCFLFADTCQTEHVADKLSATIAEVTNVFALAHFTSPQLEFISFHRMLFLVFSGTKLWLDYSRVVFLGSFFGNLTLSSWLKGSRLRFVWVWS